MKTRSWKSSHVWK